MSDDNSKVFNINTEVVETVHTHHEHEKRAPASQRNQIVAGVISGFATRAITQPFDVLKVRFQLQVEPIKKKQKSIPTTSKYTSVYQAIRVIYREEGTRAFWKGHVAGQMMSVFYSTAQFWTYEQVMAQMKKAPLFHRHHNAAHFLSGAAAGMAGTVFSMPFDVLRTRLIAQDPGRGYTGVVRGGLQIARTEGLRGLFRGLLATLIQIGPMVGLNFMFYKSFNEWTREVLDPAHGLLPTWLLLINGGAAGVASKSVTYPLDFIKKRLQIQGFHESRKTYGSHQACTGIFSCIVQTTRREGVLGFYKGMSPTLLKSGFTTAFYFAIYDRVKLLLTEYDTNRAH